jgi:hypothetical protein
MFLFVWACMWTSAFFPSAGIAALQNAANAMYSSTYAPTLNLTPARQAAQAPLISPAPPEQRRELMTLGWVHEDDAPIF